MKKGIKKKIVDKCKKITHCPYCESLNGKFEELNTSESDLRSCEGT